MIPRLEAESQRTAMQITVLGGSARVELANVRQFQAELDRAIEGGAERPRAVPASPQALAAMGIGVVVVGDGEAGHE